jgi:hypothetical protein
MNEVLQDRINNAKVFSEGNVFLEKTLLKLWDEGYSTTACCAGHPVEENENYYYPNDPNISLRYNEDNYEDIVRLLSSVDLNNLKDLSVASNKVLHLTGVKNKTNEFFNDLNKKFDEYTSYSYKDGKLWVNGISDLLIVRPDNTILIVDYKSDLKVETDDSMSFKDILMERYKGQLGLYRAAMRRIFGVDDEAISVRLYSMYETD